MFIFPAPSSCLVAFLIYLYYFFASLAGKKTSDMELLAFIQKKVKKKSKFSSFLCLADILKEFFFKFCKLETSSVLLQSFTLQTPQNKQQ